jgi:5-methylcytosine-specific restriction endonuclease McrA
VCGVFKPLREFPITRGYYEHRCRACREANSLKWTAAHRERSRKTHQRYVERHPEADRASKIKHARSEKAKARQRAYEIAHKDEINAWNRRAYQANPKVFKQRKQRYKEHLPERFYAVMCASASRRREIIAQSESHHTADDILRLYKDQNGVCAAPHCNALLSEGYHADHVIPIARGGSNAASNIQLLCPTCNYNKNDKDPVDWLINYCLPRMNGGEASA